MRIETPIACIPVDQIEAFSRHYGGRYMLRGCAKPNYITFVSVDDDWRKVLEKFLASVPYGFSWQTPIGTRH